MINREKPTVLIDMDGVQADFDTEVLSRVAERYPHIQPLNPEEHPRAFYAHNNFPEEHRATVYKICLEEGFTASLPVIPGAIEGWERIMDAGYTPRVCSSPLPTPHSEIEKLQWLEKHFVPRFGAWVVETAVVTRNKYLVDGVALIDDRPPGIKNSDQASWEHVIFDRAYNRGEAAKKYIRLNGWQDPDLAEKLACAEARARRRLAIPRSILCRQENDQAVSDQQH